MSLINDMVAPEPGMQEILQKGPMMPHLMGEMDDSRTRQLSLSVGSSHQSPAYVRFLDFAYQYEKKYVLYEYPYFDDPTIGHRPRYEQDRPQFVPGQIRQVWLWSPMMRSQMDLFALHFYESGDDPDLFSPLRILFPRFAPSDPNPDVAVFDLRSRPIPLNERTRISFLLPACGKACIDLYYWPDEGQQQA